MNPLETIVDRLKFHYQLSNQDIDTERLLEIYHQQKDKKSTQQIVNLYRKDLQSRKKTQSFLTAYPEKRLIEPLLLLLLKKYPNYPDHKILLKYNELYSKHASYYQQYYRSYPIQHKQQSLPKTIHEIWKTYLTQHSSLHSFSSLILSGHFTNKIDPKTGLLKSSLSLRDRRSLLDQLLHVLDILHPLVPFPYQHSIDVYRCIHIDSSFEWDPPYLLSLLATSWTYQRSFAEYWCSTEHYHKDRIILHVTLTPQDFYILNEINRGQFEVILMPCILEFKSSKQLMVTRFIEVKPLYLPSSILSTMYDPSFQGIHEIVQNRHQSFIFLNRSISS